MNSRTFVILSALCVFATPAFAAEFTYELSKPAVTSAGVYDDEGRLLKTLWTMKETAAGRQRESYEAPAGAHRVTVVANRATYANVGVIGNSAGHSERTHTPTNMESVAVDKDGNVYTANGWDEAGADFKRWDAAGRSVYDAQYAIRNGRPNGAPYAIAVDEEYVYCAVGGWDREPWNNRQQIQRFRLKDGKPAPFTGRSETSQGDDRARGPRQPKGPAERLLDGHIQLYEWPALQVPAGTSESDARLMRTPLRAIDVSGSTVYVADALAGKIRMFDSESGAAKGGFDVHLPHAVAVDPTGQIWVAHDHSSVTAYRADGYSGVTYGPLGDVTSLAFGPGAKLYAADAESGRVLTLDAAASPAQFVPVLGSKAKAGDRAADRFYKLRGVAADNAGNLFTIQREPGSSGARLAKWSPERKLLWEQFATEFVSLGNYGQADPDTFYTVTHHRHRLLDRAKGTWDYLGCAADIDAFPTSDNTYRSDPHGVPRVLRIGARDFVFMPTGDGVQVYRVDGGVLRLASLVGGRDPDPTGDKGKGKVSQWTWSDVLGTGRPDPAAIRPVDDHYTCFGMDVGPDASVWFANTHTHSVWTLPLAGVDGRGNPTYDWRQAREAAPRDSSEFGFDPTMVQPAADGSFYALGWSKPFPSPKDNPFWMGGTTLARIDKAGRRVWAVELPQVCVGMDVIPPGKNGQGGGVIVGTGKGANLLHYTAGGLLIGRASPGEAMSGKSGWLDNHASVAVNRDPRDGVVDVFTEDDLVCRIGWYRIDDRDIEVINGAAVGP